MLEIIARTGAEAVVGVADVMEAMIDAGYGASHGKLSRAMRKIEKRRANEYLDREKRRREYQRYATMMYKLERDGLIVKKRKGAQTKVSLTSAGSKKLALLLERRKDSALKTSYSPAASQQFTIVAFDIPERDRKKRGWLRAVLKHLGFSMIQKSVWIGKVKIPEELIEDMKKMRMLEFVEIFEISRTGSLEHIV